MRKLTESRRKVNSFLVSWWRKPFLSGISIQKHMSNMSKTDRSTRKFASRWAELTHQKNLKSKATSKDINCHVMVAVISILPR